MILTRLAVSKPGAHGIGNNLLYPSMPTKYMVRVHALTYNKGTCHANIVVVESLSLCCHLVARHSKCLGINIFHCSEIME